MAAEFYGHTPRTPKTERESARHRFSRFAKRMSELSQLEHVAEQHAVPEHASIKGGYVKTYQMGYKDVNEVGQTLDLESVAVKYEMPKGKPKFQHVQQAAPTIIKFEKRRPRTAGIKTAIVLPDVQIGYLRHIDDVNQMDPMHDEIAMDVALQIVADNQPDKIVHIGDLLDLSEMSRWMQHEEFWRTTQPAIDRAHRFLAETEAAGGDGREQTEFVAGNHEKRLREYLAKNARAAYGLRKANSPLAEEPPFTIPWFLRFDELNIKYAGEWPASEVWLTDDLVVRHDPVGKYDYEASVISGHDHQLKRDTFSRRGRYGNRQYTNYSAGCLCRVDDRLDLHSLMRTNVPSDKGFVKDWAQGLVIVTIDERDGTHHAEQVEIRKGKALYRGRSYVAGPKRLLD